jgi:hypothetical protein
LRLFVVAGLGLAFAAPAAGLAYHLYWRERTLAANVAREFLQALRGQSTEHDAESLLLPDRALGQLTQLLPAFHLLRLPSLESHVDSVTTKGDAGEAHFVLRLKEDSALPNSATAEPAPGAILDPIAVASLRKSQQAVGPQGIVHLQRVRGQWRVHGFTFPVGDDGSGQFTEFESKQQAAERAQRMAFEQQALEFKQLRPVDPRQCAAAWQIDVNVHDRPVRQLVQELERPLGINLSSSFPVKQLDKLLSLQLSKCSPLEAIDHVCRHVGLSPQYQLGKMYVQPDSGRSEPAVFAGPFHIGVDPQWPNIASQGATDAVDVLPLQFTAPALPPAVAFLLDGNQLEVRALQIHAADGRDLYHAEAQPFFIVTKNFTALPGDFWSYQEKRTLPLKNLLADLEVLHRVEGRLRIPLPTRVDILRFDTLVPGAVQQSGDVRCTIEQFGQGPALATAARPPIGMVGAKSVGGPELHIQWQGIEGRSLRWWAYDHEGKAIGNGREKNLRSAPLQLAVPLGTERIAFLLVGATEYQEYAFQLRDIPLKNRPPQRLQPARFPGHAAPLTVQVAPIARPQAGGMSAGQIVQRLPTEAPLTFQVANHSQKSVLSIQLKLSYRDAAGRLLGQGTRTLAPIPQDYSYRFPMLIEPRSYVPVQSVSYLSLPNPALPDGTSSVDVQVLRVGFVDGTSWSAPTPP